MQLRRCAFTATISFCSIKCAVPFIIHPLFASSHQVSSFIDFEFPEIVLLFPAKEQIQFFAHRNKKDGYRQRNVFSFCNQPKAHYLATSRESRRFIVAFSRCDCWHLATSRESKAHFGLPWVRPWDNRGKCHTVVKRIQCL